MSGSSIVPASCIVAVEVLLVTIFSKATSLEELHLWGLNFPIASSPLVHIQRLHTVELKAERSTAIAQCLKTLSTAEKLVDFSAHRT
ncbi:hypothetical protein B0H21DRAFT_195824 [Amylocystis lapponica]|nr:hypothetical protein B0H21DRAFT_195824 [Amylocystis lapponica]